MTDAGSSYLPSPTQTLSKLSPADARPSHEGPTSSGGRYNRPCFIQLVGFGYHHSITSTKPGGGSYYASKRKRSGNPQYYWLPAVTVDPESLAVQRDDEAAEAIYKESLGHILAKSREQYDYLAGRQRRIQQQQQQETSAGAPQPTLAADSEHDPVVLVRYLGAPPQRVKLSYGVIANNVVEDNDGRVHLVTEQENADRKIVSYKHGMAMGYHRPRNELKKYYLAIAREMVGGVTGELSAASSPGLMQKAASVLSAMDMQVLRGLFEINRIHNVDPLTVDGGPRSKSRAPKSKSLTVVKGVDLTVADRASGSKYLTIVKGVDLSATDPAALHQMICIKSIAVRGRNRTSLTSLPSVPASGEGIVLKKKKKLPLQVKMFPAEGLPAGWTREIRSSMTIPGRWDAYFRSPDGKTMRSIVAVIRNMEERITLGEDVTGYKPELIRLK